MSESSNFNSPLVVAVDFSEDSMAALKWACRFAETTGAPLVVLHVVHDLASNPGFYHQVKTSGLQPMEDVAESMMDEFLHRLRSEHPELQILDTAELQFVPGLPATRIVEVSSLLHASLIAVGSRGITSLPHRLLGATAEKVAELSKIPVVIIKSDSHGILNKKELKRQEKQRKKDRKRLKRLLGVTPEESGKADTDE